MLEKIKEWLGLDRQSPYVRQYFEASNARSSIYMSVIIIALESWMIISLYSILMGDDGQKSVSWIISHLICYILLLAAGIMTLFYAERFLRTGASHSKYGQISLFIFSVVCFVFGIYISYLDYSKGEQILTLVTMAMFVVCVLVWRPIVSGTMLTVAFVVFYILMRREGPVSRATNINFFIMWISLFVTSISIYRQKKTEAMKDESLESANEHLRKMALIDELTGLASMPFFMKRASEILSEKDVKLQNKIFLYLDIENFKAINEKYGFESGNAFLIKFANTAVDTFADGLIARQSDDHFFILTDKIGCNDRLAALRSVLYDFGDEATQIGLKTGGYVPEARDCDISVACDRARYACNSIKKHYECDFREYDADMEQDFSMKQYIVNNVDLALDRGDIKVYYQPVVWAKNRKLCGYEALAKWEDEKYGFISPGIFIPILEEYRQVHKLDMIVVDTVCKDLRMLMDRNLPTVPVSLNFSRLDFELTDVVEILESCVNQYDIPRDYIHVEVTESALSGRLDLLKGYLDRLRNLGYPLWLDDFGSGFSSLNVLKDFEFDVLKIDMVFLSSFKSHEVKTKAILKNIVTLARDIGMNTLTEGVETSEEAAFLNSIGCERLQGYLFGKAMPLKDAQIKIAAGTLPVSEEFLNGAG